MIRGEILAGVMMCGLAGQLGASMLGANPAAALFLSPLTAGRTALEIPVSRSACTFLTSSALVPDLQGYAAAATGSADLMALLEISE